MFVTEHVQSSSDKALQNFHENHRSMIVLTAISMRFSKTFFVGRFLTFKKKIKRQSLRITGTYLCSVIGHCVLDAQLFLQPPIKGARFSAVFWSQCVSSFRRADTLYLVTYCHHVSDFRLAYPKTLYSE